MLVAIDYDDTWTRDPKAWYSAMMMLKAAGHEVIGVTMRCIGESGNMDPLYEAVCSEVFFTSRQAKKAYLKEYDVHPDVWIDDNPAFILVSATS